jgi:uncharacterized protein (DUF934 family)
MKQVILNKAKVYKNDYFSLESIDKLPKSNSEKVIVTIKQWLENKTILKRKKYIGIKLNSDESINSIKKDINYFKIIQFNFLTFKDGRPFSEAKKLRVEFKFKNEIRASGHILPDQYIFLLRCGFNSVEIESAKKKYWLDFLKMDSGLYYQP